MSSAYLRLLIFLPAILIVVYSCVYIYVCVCVHTCLCDLEQSQTEVLVLDKELFFLNNMKNVVEISFKHIPV